MSNDSDPFRTQIFIASKAAPGIFPGVRPLLTCVWMAILLPLHGIEWQIQPFGRLATSAPSTASPRTVGFTQLPPATLGIGFTNLLSDNRSVTNRNLASGSGVAAGDVDGDGLCDLYFCGLDGPNALFRNLGGWRFENVTHGGSIACDGQDSTGAAFADVDADGDLDLLVNSLGGGTHLFLNDSHGQFTESTDTAGLRSRSGATSLALADVDADGDLDLYVANFRPWTVMDQPSTQYQVKRVGQGGVIVGVNGRPTTDWDLTNRFEMTPAGDVLEFGEPDVLWLNDGKGGFRAIDWLGGAFLDEDGKPLKVAPRDWGLACRFADLNADGKPDLYVCNDLHTPDRIWINESAPGRVQFRALSRLALRSNSTFSMGVDVGDLNRDGFVDIFTVDMASRSPVMRQTQMEGAVPPGRRFTAIDERVQVHRNALHYGRGDGTFSEVAYFAGVPASEWSWGPIFLDVDLDGYEDILITNGQIRDFQDSDGAARIQAAQRSGRTLTPALIAELTRSFPRLLTPNVAFRNRRDGRFEDVSEAWGFGIPGISQGMALADLDNDGDMDVVINNLLEPPLVLRNDTVAPRIAVRLHGVGANRFGIGAMITVRGGPVVQTQDMIAGGRYMSGDDPVRTFAAGTAQHLEVDVAWPSGKRSRVASVAPGSLVEIDEATATERIPTPVPPSFQRLFEDISSRVNHLHEEMAFDDMERQPLLPRRLSQSGPGLSWIDVNKDGLEDLVVGASRGGRLGVYQNLGSGNFRRMEGAAFAKPAGRDFTSILGIEGNLLIGSSHFRDGSTNGGHLRILDPASQASGEIVLGPRFAVGPLAAADVDGDGTLEVFVGGRSVAGRYPEPADSLLLKNSGGRFSVAQRFSKLGMVSGAVFTDIDGDGDPDLALACEWGSVRLFENRRGKLEDATEAWGLAGLTGWWNGIAAGDFNGDGRMDLVASNWGWNTRYAASAREPRVIYYGNLEGASTEGVDLVETRVDATAHREWIEREYPALASVFPWFRERMPTYAAYSTATLGDVFEKRLETCGRLTATTLASSVFLNRGGKLEAHELPAEAQWAPGMGVCVGDADGDGREDIFLAQNFFAVAPMGDRADGGRGLWLMGDGNGGFAANLNSGVDVYGEQRGAAVADFDQDGRLDLAVTQNGNPTRVFRNTAARPGIRVVVQGPASNPEGYGTVLRGMAAGRLGPAHELHNGSGYWSSDAPTCVLTMPGEVPIDRVWVRFPGKEPREVPIKPGEKTIRLTP